MTNDTAPKNIKSRVFVIIFGADTPAGKLFDVILLWAILLSVFIVMLESVNEIKADFGKELYIIEWFFTVLFTIEYIARIYASPKPLKYVFSFFGIIDLLSILPSFLGLVLTGAHSLMIIRSIRLLRIFRVLKMARFIGEASSLIEALRASRTKITIFIGTLFLLTVVLGTIMYLVEGAENGFTSIPRSIYWAVVTLTTVGYGDISPHTTLGQLIATIVMVLGYGIIAVPTGIVSAEMNSLRNKMNQVKAVKCHKCNAADHRVEASHCYNCGTLL
ncbi:MAG TPA: ion transporter [Fulvivirga sp.]|nr:ion transporter [Fulvivirga sp.]